MNFYDKVPGDLKLFIGGYVFRTTSRKRKLTTSRLMALHGTEALVNAGVTHVLSAINYRLEPRMIERFTHFQIKLEDDEDEDIIQFFPQTNKFIDDALRSGGGVFVHW